MDITQGELARRAGVSPSMITKCLNKQTPWTERVAKGVAEALGLMVEELFEVKNQ